MPDRDEGKLVSLLTAAWGNEPITEGDYAGCIRVVTGLYERPTATGYVLHFNVPELLEAMNLPVSRRNLDWCRGVIREVMQGVAPGVPHMVRRERPTYPGRGLDV